MIDRENAVPRARISLLDYLQQLGWNAKQPSAT